MLKTVVLSARLALAVLLTAVSIVALGGSAQASGGLAPSCVKRYPGSTGGMPDAAQVTVRNRCSTTQRVQVVFTHAHDSDCMRIAPGRSRTVHSNIAYPFSHYDKTIRC